MGKRTCSSTYVYLLWNYNLWLCGPLLGLERIQFLDPIHSRYDPLDGESARRKASTYTQNKRKQTSMPRVGFKSTTPVLELARTVHAADRAATGIGLWNYYLLGRFKLQLLLEVYTAMVSVL
jgi:hypothetical protein